MLMYRPVGEEESFNEGGERMLLAFSRLHTGGDEELIAFAQKWGVLHICRHQLPRSHVQIWSDSTVKNCERMYKQTRGGWRLEPTSAWVRFSRAAAALTKIMTHACGDQEPPIRL